MPTPIRKKTDPGIACPKCSKVNSVGVRHCGNCGRGLSLLDQIFHSATVGFLNGWAIAVLMVIGVEAAKNGWKLYIGQIAYYDLGGDLVTLLSYIPFLGAILGGLFAAFLYPVFYLTILKRFPFWTTWRMAFPITLGLTSLGWAFQEFLGAYACSAVGLLLTTYILKTRAKGFPLQ
jgi:hypothetical protein